MTPLAFLKPKSSDPDEYRKELILNIIIGFCLLIISLFFLMVLNNDIRDRSYVGTAYFLLISFPIAIAYRLSRTGRIFTASCTVIAFFSFGLLYSAYSWGAILPTVLLGIAFISTCASLLINSRAGFIYAASASAIIFAIQFMHQYGIHSPDYSWTGTAPDVMDIVEYSILILFISGISWLSNRQTESALVRAQASERDLSIERDSLEIKVAERTKALEYAQIEKTTEMYRFVEFGKLSAGLIHDLMSPLTALCMETETSGVKTAEAMHRSEAIRAAMGASRKIQDIISATRHQIKAEYGSERISIKQTVQDSMLLQQSRIKKLNITAHTGIPSSLHIEGSPTLLSHILTNLISNAIDAVEAKKAAMRSAHDPVLANNSSAYVPTIEIFSVQRPDRIKIYVRDNGIGIPKEIEQNIFDPFFTTKKHTGWGYGLSASRHIAEKYFGGSISVDSGKKTTMILNVPFRRA